MKSILNKKIFIILFIIFINILSFSENIGLPDISIDIQQTQPNTLNPVLEIVLIITVISIAPGLLMLLTSFTRLVVTMGFLRQALGTRQAPPNQVLVALALFLTIMIMYPTFDRVYNEAIIPYNNQEIGYEEVIEKAYNPFKDFMLREIIDHKNQDNIILLANSTNTQIQNIEDTPFQILIPAFALSELEISFKMGLLLYIPFILVDMVVASILLSMGMIMIPPVLISLPFKIMLFIIVNGWDLVIGSLVRSFGGG
ncbi:MULTISPECIES: flagellar type III secretion system pore protein FliP [Oceanotoga]|jgi:flagellar biosynthetic protein FliP|uniref:Flagellar biosynthetic protein FliP n=1 Tax=Oceanotoga teriensis TaxID=515440 RepID=A0AA45C5E6_9BACT|nr:MULTISPECIES: flagellar type III secretion system pore protein FliP [Oceanotoga]MDN5342285.1 flagellar biosynthesis protein FliP [Oceanotoga sp.]MDO7977348.1 flagellar type III secretion system pore protein FliP [Oceanotoga teriensis]PWJ88738.1 flagellar biosynthetic protein FliP [Oceanotoga teriensis]